MGQTLSVLNCLANKELALDLGLDLDVKFRF